MAHNRRLGVASYFVNVDNGDAAIHIISFELKVANPIKRVESAILMDGAEANPVKSTKVESRIYVTIRDIEDEFECQNSDLVDDGTQPHVNPRKRPQFDAFVVTHWDYDHYEGVMWYLYHDMLAEFKAKRQRLSRAIFKYDVQAAKYVPQSTFYAPSWRRNYCEGLNPHYRGLERFRTPHDSNTKANNGWRNQHWCKDQLRMRIGSANLLGRNLFERAGEAGEVPAGAQGSKNLATLLAAHGTKMYPRISGDLHEGTHLLGMYCVAVHRWVISQVPVNLLTPINNSSICCLLAWKPDDYISLYTAGDAHAELEIRISS
ncbi:hypothetical protein QBC35DRAFT_539112 [Podospora australis]|uniref:Metallo-beta-lactamase domain-containing protein n=1 Tax=Podospora australis TaxID=1536484 RepID=A0AAN7AGG7_9PEZI|nr:hypothetical protein QBC35DRAFT_539112 [Podospora australis]